MPSIQSLTKKINSLHPDINLVKSDDFYWSPAEKTIYYDATCKNCDKLLIHELAHALLNHSDYSGDIMLLEMECEAWSHTDKLAKEFGIEIPQHFVEENLDSYRDWLHKRSTCPNCQSLGIEKNCGHYSCPLCKTSWLPNEGKTRRLKRKIINKK